MAAEAAISNHLIRRNGVPRNVRRVPEDVRDVFPFTRVQSPCKPKWNGALARLPSTSTGCGMDALRKHASAQVSSAVLADGP